MVNIMLTERRKTIHFVIFILRFLFVIQVYGSWKIGMQDDGRSSSTVTLSFAPVSDSKRSLLNRNLEVLTARIESGTFVLR